jgi:hypothetical protein
MMNSKLTRAALVSAIALAFSAPTFAQSSSGSQGGSNSMQSSPQTKHGTAAATPSAPSAGVTGGNVWTSDGFKRLDKNGDGMISRDEAQADPLTRDHWTKLDKANRGSVDMSTYEQYGRTLNPNSATPKGHPFSADQKK